MTSPKERFLDNKEAARQHAVVAENSVIQESLESALAEMVMSQPQAANAVDAAKAHYQIEGAKRFIKIWTNLSTVTPQKTTTSNGNLSRQ